MPKLVNHYQDLSGFEWEENIVSFAKFKINLRMECWVISSECCEVLSDEIMLMLETGGITRTGEIFEYAQ